MPAASIRRPRKRQHAAQHLDRGLQLPAIFKGRVKNDDSLSAGSFDHKLGENKLCGQWNKFQAIN
jgi:hypothetical protein